MFQTGHQAHGLLGTCGENEQDPAQWFPPPPWPLPLVPSPTLVGTPPPDLLFTPYLPALAEFWTPGMNEGDLLGSQ